MFIDYYNLKEHPFQITPDPKFAWLGEKHAEALATLEYGIEENKGFIVLTGDVGTGKTLLVNCLLNRMDKNIIAVKISNPSVAPVDFFNFISAKLDWQRSFRTKGKFLLHLENYLYQVHSENKKVLLIIDEAHTIKSTVLEEIRLLSNIEFENKKLLIIVIVGQIELEHTLRKAKNKALRERITVWCHLDPLTKRETGQYINYRLAVAGSERNFFTLDAMREIYFFSKGIPRQINILCDQALLTGLAYEFKEIDAQIVEECAQDLKMISDRAKEENPELKVDKINEAQTFGKEIDIQTLTESAQDLQMVSDTNETENAEEKIDEKIETQSIISALKNQTPTSQIFAFLSIILLIVTGYLIYHLKTWSKEDSIPQQSKNYSENKDLTPTQQTIEFKESQTQIPDVSNDPREAMENLKLDPGIELKAEEAEVIQDNFREELPVELNIGKHFKHKNIVIYFKRDSQELKEMASEKLDDIAGILKANPEAGIKIRGYTDDSGSFDYNLYISELRANSVKSYLLNKGVDISRIEVFGLGPENPIASNETLEGRELNRRVEVEIFNKNSM